jgi:hypothetical protein
MNLGTFFKDIGKGLKDVIVGFPAAITKLIVLSKDAESIASDAANEVITVSTDVAGLVSAVAKDDGASLQAIEALIAATSSAIAAKGLNFTEDAAIISAVEAFFATINGTNYADVIAAIAKVITDGKTMTATVIADFKKLETDATN